MVESLLFNDEEDFDTKAGWPGGKSATFVNCEVYDQSDFNQTTASMDCMLYAISGAISEQLAQRTQGKLRVLPRQFYDALIMQYDEAQLYDQGGISSRQLATDLNEVIIPFLHNRKRGIMQVEFRYYARKDIRDQGDTMEINNGATFVVLEPTEPFGKHAVFVYGVDEERKEYIVLDSVKERRDSNSIQVSGVKKPNQRVPWYIEDPNTRKANLTDNVIVWIQWAEFDEERCDLRQVDFFNKEQVKEIPKGDGSPAYLCEPTKFTQFVDGKLKERINKIKKTTVSEMRYVNPGNPGTEQHYTGEVDEYQRPCGVGTFRIIGRNFSSTYHGQWLFGYRNGIMTNTHSCGQRFEGEQLNGRLHGKHTYYMENGRIDNVLSQHGHFGWQIQGIKPDDAWYRNGKPHKGAQISEQHLAQIRAALLKWRQKY